MQPELAALLSNVSTIHTCSRHGGCHFRDVQKGGCHAREVEKGGCHVREVARGLQPELAAMLSNVRSSQPRTTAGRAWQPAWLPC